MKKDLKDLLVGVTLAALVALTYAVSVAWAAGPLKVSVLKFLSGSSLKHSITVDSDNALAFQDAGGQTTHKINSSGQFEAIGVGGKIKASTSTSSTSELCLAGAFDNLPSSGWPAYCIAILTSDSKVYSSTPSALGATSTVETVWTTY